MGGGGSKAKMCESRQQTDRVRAQEQARIRIAQEQQRTVQIKLQQQERDRIRQMKQNAYNKQYNLKMEQLKSNRQARAAEAEAERYRQRQTHETRMRQMQIEAEERDKERRKQLLTQRINACNAEIGKLNTMITNDTNQLKNDKPIFEKVSQQLAVSQKYVNNFTQYKTTELGNYRDRLRLPEAEREFKAAEKQVQAHINNTGQIESKVGEFLNLFALLVSATISTTAHSNKLDAEISTLGELIRKECQDKLTIEHYFTQKNLSRFIPILAAEGFDTVDGLVCQTDEEYDEILMLLEKGIKKQIESHKNVDDISENKEEKKEMMEEEVDVEELAQKLLKSWRLIKFRDALQDEGYDDPKYWKEITNNELKDMGFKTGNVKKFKGELKEWLSDNKILTEMEKRLLNGICCKPESWMKYEQELSTAVKEGLDEVGPLLGTFFMRIHTAIKQSQEILNYEIDLNDTQCKAIKMVNELPPALEYKESSYINDEIKDDEYIQPNICDDIRHEWKINSKCQIYSESNNKWCNGVIIDITNDDEGEWLHVKYCVNNRLYKTKEIQRSSTGIRPLTDDVDGNKKLALQCHALTTASLISIDVTDLMMDEFNRNVLTTRALAVARGVEDCCMQMIKAQSTIRQSVLLAQEVTKHKPASMSKEAEKLWNAADDGAIRIVKTAITMVRVSAQYFGFFLRFQQSFKFYESRKDCSLMVSLQHLHKDVKEFTQFQQTFAKQVQALSKEAMDCISNCIRSGGGATQFEDWRHKRDMILKTLLDLKKKYHEKELELDNQLDMEQQKRINLCADEARLSYKVKTLEAAITNNMDYKQKYMNAKSQLEQMLVKI